MKVSTAQPVSASVDDLVDLITQLAHTLNPTSARNGEDGMAIDAKQAGDISVAKSRMLTACRDLINVVSGPTEILKNMALIDKHNLISLRVVNQYHVAEIVPLTGTVLMSTVAQECRLSCNTLTRILRQAMTYGVFSEPEPGYIAHTAMSREIPRLAPLLTYQLEICLPSTLALPAWLELEASDEDEHVAAPFQIAHDTKDSWWTYAEKRPELTEDYGRYQALITHGGPHDVSHVVSGFAWNKLGSALVIDIGGADGFVATTIASACPQLTIIVQDSAALQTSAGVQIPAALRDRVLFAPHSFFEPQAAAIGQHADVFLLRHILHDWNDASCVRILRHLTHCMKPGARIIVAEQVLRGPGEVDPATDRVMRALDMQMLVQFGGKERTMADWAALFELADSRLRIVAVVKPEGSSDSLLELTLQDE